MNIRSGVISADDHVQETPDLWKSRLSKEQWGDRIPQLVPQPYTSERWMVDGRLKVARALAWTGALAENRYEEPQTWDEVPKAAYDPTERLNAMDRDGVDVQVLYPSAAGLSGEAFCTLEDPPLELACVQAYNDWLIDAWAKASDRFIPQCIVPMHSAQAAAREIERAVGRGHRGVVIPPVPWRLNPKLPHINSKDWDPVWATAQGLGVPVCFHSGSDPSIMLEIYPGFDPAMKRAFDSIRRPISNAIILANFLLSGIPERFPKLKAVFAGAAVDWVPFQLENSDHEWDRSMLAKEGMAVKPTEIFHRQCYVTTWADRAALQVQRSFIGVENILWQSEFPMETSTYPSSREHIKANFQGVPQEERQKMLCGNAAKLYGIPVSANGGGQ